MHSCTDVHVNIHTHLQCTYLVLESPGLCKVIATTLTVIMASVTIIVTWMERDIRTKQHSGKTQRGGADCGQPQWPVGNLDSQLDEINRSLGEK